MKHRVWWTCLVLVAAGACARAPKPKAPQPAPAESPRERLDDLLPAPQRVDRGQGQFVVAAGTVIVAPPDNPAGQRIARQLADLVRRASGLTPVVAVEAMAPADGQIVLSLDGAAGELGEEGYDLTIAPSGVRLRAAQTAGLFYGVQTLRQLLPYFDEYEAVSFERPRPAILPAAHIVDRPRFGWRGAMLDVARHFFSVDEVERYIDLLALHKINRLHLHLADDQGWRIEITSWPDLTAKGGASEVGGGPGGFYTQEQYRQLVAYAADRYITIVPEIDMPGHTNAALASYAELNCDGKARSPFTGTDVGFSALCVDKEITYKFIDDVVREIAAMTPGEYFHAGGDEVKTLSPEKYQQFVERVQQIVEAHGKRMIGWDETATARLLPTSVVQYWRPEAPKDQLARAPHLIFSPANRAYLDMKYDAATALGLDWAGTVTVRQAYDWDPSAAVQGLPAGALLGVEAPMWSETLTNMRDVEFLAFPRIAALADLAWSPASSHDWKAFSHRLAAQAPRWTALGINFYRTPEIRWKP